MARTGLYLFTQDLRLADLPLLHQAAEENDELLLVYVLDPRLFQVNPRPGPFSLKRLGQHRWRFLLDTLQELDQQLQSLGQRLHLMLAQPLKGLAYLIERHGISRLYSSEPSGWEERQLHRRLTELFSDLTLVQANQQRLWSLDALPFKLEELPATFSQFRKQVEPLKVQPPVAGITQLPPAPKPLPANALDHPPACSQMTQPAFAGGELAGQAHLQQYFSSRHPSSYKLTRNALDGHLQSTCLSPWLAQGCLSPRQVVAALQTYEAQVEANESTYWIFFELLWREYFQLYALRQGTRLFAFAGIHNRKPLTSFYAQRYRAWCEGETDWPIVNACMKQLKQTGWMSNRGRQLVASCLVNELQVDWRYGAAWFEQQLIDYEVASNWGNWQYLAGVGADPRGQRRFNLDKQAATYDPDSKFTQHWLGT